MTKNLLLFFFIALTFSSCQFFEPQPTKEELLQKELRTINWKEVDEFPSVVGCDNLTDKKLRQQCFFEFLTQTIQMRLDTDTLKILYPQLDTISVKVTVFPNATMQFEPLFPKDSTTYDTVKIDSILRSRLTDMPKINPAIKRGIPVKTQFVLPVILKIE